MPHDAREPAPEAVPRNLPRRRWPLTLAIAAMATLGMCIVLPSLLPVDGKHRTRAEFEALVTNNRSALEELIALARKETKPVEIQRRGGDTPEAYGALLARLDLPGPLWISVEPFEVRLLVYRPSGRDRTELIFGREPRPADIVDDLDRAREANPGGGSAYMRLPGKWLAWQTWD